MSNFDYHHDVSKSEQQKWRDCLERQDRKIDKKNVQDLKKLVYKETQWTDGDHVIVAKNFWGNPVTIKAKTKQECFENLATLNGYTIKK